VQFSRGNWGDGDWQTTLCPVALLGCAPTAVLLNLTLLSCLCITVTISQSADDLAAEKIATYDIILFYGSGGTISDRKQEQGLWNFAHQGGGIVGVHATDANKSSDVYWELLGGRFIGHGSAK
jgi:type 1 glutamine amidotransferase